MSVKFSRLAPWMRRGIEAKWIFGVGLGAGRPYLQRLGFVCSLPLSHSARSASTGFTRVARLAGSQAASMEITVAASAQAP